MLGRTRASSSQYQSQNEDQYQIERNIANEIMDTIHRLQLPLKLDQLTEGLGNCFPIAVIQQLQRPEIFSQLRPAPKRLVRHKTGHSLLRQCVHQFIMKSRSPRIATFRSQYEETDGPVNGETWSQYWARMITDKTWVDYWFVQATAWYLQLDMWIIATSSTDTSPYIEVSGNLADGTIPSVGPIITLGTKSNSHYQSLLPIEMFHLESQQNPANPVSKTNIHDEVRPSENKQAVEGNEDRYCNKVPNYEYHAHGEPAEENHLDIKNENQPFIYESNQKLLVFLCKSCDYIMKCPMCLIETKHIIQHISKSKNCKIPGPLNSFKEQFKLYKESFRKEEQRKRKEEFRMKKRQEDNEKVKQQQRKWTDVSRAKKRAEDNAKVKDQQKSVRKQAGQRKEQRIMLKLKISKESVRKQAGQRKEQKIMLMLNMSKENTKMQA